MSEEKKRTKATTRDTKETEKVTDRLADVAKKQGVEVPAVKLFQSIKLGSKGQNVKNVQTLLKIQADGSFGPATEKVVKSFQKKEGLKITGIIDEETFRRIKGVK
jgi:peptidoglycan hydrolase-like protein with peptidoglycan-binding domain